MNISTLKYNVILNVLMWKRKSTRIVFKNNWMTVYEDKVLTRNGEIDYTRTKEDDHVVIIPFSRPNGIYMIYNYRYVIKKTCLELPAGHIDKNETVIQSAKRELYEETGLQSKNMKNLGWFYLNESKSKSKVFVCYTDAFDMGKKHTDKSEEILVGKMKITNIFQLLERGKIKHVPTIIALYWLKSSSKLSLIERNKLLIKSRRIG